MGQKKQNVDASVAARGHAARAREVGKQNNVFGFGYGRGDGDDRRAANAIVHAPVGQARHRADEARRLDQKAHGGICLIS